MIRGTYKADAEYIMWEYKTVSDFWPDIEHDSDYIDDE